jgi:hypothetical protein
MLFSSLDVELEELLIIPNISIFLIYTYIPLNPNALNNPISLRTSYRGHPAHHFRHNQVIRSNNVNHHILHTRK